MCAMRSAHSKRRPLARLSQQASARMTIPTASVAVVFHATLDNDVPSRVELWSRSRRPVIGNRICVSKITPRTAPEYPQGHAQCKNGRAFSGMAKRFGIPIFGMHRSTLLGKVVSCLISQPHSQRYRIANSLTITAVAGYPNHFNAIAPYVMHKTPEFPPEFKAELQDAVNKC